MREKEKAVLHHGVPLKGLRMKKASLLLRSLRGFLLASSYGGTKPTSEIWSHTLEPATDAIYKTTQKNKDFDNETNRYQIKE